MLNQNSFLLPDSTLYLPDSTLYPISLTHKSECVEFSLSHTQDPHYLERVPEARTRYVASYQLLLAPLSY